MLGLEGGNWSLSHLIRLCHILADPANLAHLTRLAEGFTRQQLDSSEQSDPCLLEYLQQMNDKEYKIDDVLACFVSLNESHPMILLDVDANTTDADPPLAGKCTRTTGATIQNKIRQMKRVLTQMHFALTKSGSNESGWDETDDAYRYATGTGDLSWFVMYTFGHAHPNILNMLTRELPPDAKLESGTKRPAGERGSPKRSPKQSKVTVDIPEGLFSKSVEEKQQMFSVTEPATAEKTKASCPAPCPQ